MTALGQLSCESFEYGTTPELCDAGRFVLGGDFDLDPCSSAMWNAVHVRAVRYIDQVENGLRADWRAHRGMRISCNPPSLVVADFFRRCMDAWDAGAAVWWLGFSLEQLPYVTADGLMEPEFSRAFLRSRVKWLQGVANPPQRPLFGERVDVPALAPLPNPTHANYIALLPAPGYVGQEQRHRFTEACERLGAKEF